MSIPTILTIKEMRQLVWRWKSDDKRVGFVPTMGALHSGHLKLVEYLSEHCEKIVVSIFVNPLQFGPNEDFSRYPRTLPDDLRLLETVKADAVFCPNSSEIYPKGFQTIVSNKELSGRLCGQFRPGHFDGVLTVVNKLFQAVSPNFAAFGKKDFQQFKMIQRMVTDFCMPIEVLGMETIRGQDGLALSSRNRYLSSEQREQAPLIFAGLNDAKKAWKAGEKTTAKLTEIFKLSVSKCSEMKIQYCDIVDSDNLNPLDGIIEEGIAPVMIVAVVYNDVRLIDNLELGV
jgi:pantoate--beta-alanine ligase